MKTAIIPIGNSKGIRIPKVLLEQCNIKSIVDLETKGHIIIIRPINESPRKRWSEAFAEMRELEEDRSLIDDNIDLDVEGWEW